MISDCDSSGAVAYNLSAKIPAPAPSHPRHFNQAYISTYGFSHSIEGYDFVVSKGNYRRICEVSDLNSPRDPEGEIYQHVRYGYRVKAHAYNTRAHARVLIPAKGRGKYVRGKYESDVLEGDLAPLKLDVNLPGHGSATLPMGEFDEYGKRKHYCGEVVQRQLPMTADFKTDLSQCRTIFRHCGRASCPICGFYHTLDRARDTAYNICERARAYLVHARGDNPNAEVYAYHVVASYEPYSMESRAFFESVESYRAIRKQIAREVERAIPGYLGAYGIPHHLREADTKPDQDISKGVAWRDSPHIHYVVLTDRRLTRGDMIGLKVTYEKRGNLLIKVRGHNAPKGADMVDYHDPIPFKEIGDTIAYASSHACVVYDTDKDAKVRRAVNFGFGYGILSNNAMPGAGDIAFTDKITNSEGLPFYDLEDALMVAEHLKEDPEPLTRRVHVRAFRMPGYTKAEHDLTMERVDREIGEHNRAIELLRNPNYSTYDPDQADYWDAMYEYIVSMDPGGNVSDWFEIYRSDNMDPVEKWGGGGWRQCPYSSAQTIMIRSICSPRG